MSSSLLLTRRFAPLFWTQFFSAFSDNFLKNSLVFLILFHIGGSDAEALITLAAAVFIAPYFFLSALGGELADRYDKAVVARRLKFAEIGIAFIAVFGFAVHSVPVLFVALFLFGVIASLFGPIKYGILPDHLARSELPAGNALVEGATFIAILLGTIVGGVAAKDGGDPSHFAFLMIVFSLMCWSASLLIPRTGQAAPDLVVQKNILASTAGLLKFLRADPRLLWGALVTSWFWLVGAVALSLMPPLVKNVLGGNEEVVTACLAIFSIFIAVGSGLAAWLAAGRIILLPTLIGAVLLGLFAIDLGFAGDEGVLQVADFLGVGDALDGLDAGAVQRGRQHQAAAHDPAVDAHRAGPAHAVLAAGVGAHQAQIEAQEVDEMPARLDAAGNALAIDGERDVDVAAHAARASSVPAMRRNARASSTRARWRFICGLPCRSAGGSRSPSSAACAAAIVSALTILPATAAVARSALTGLSPTPKNTTLGSTSVLPASFAFAATPAMA